MKGAKHGRPNEELFVGLHDRSRSGVDVCLWQRLTRSLRSSRPAGHAAHDLPQHLRLHDRGGSVSGEVIHDVQPLRSYLTAEYDAYLSENRQFC